MLLVDIPGREPADIEVQTDKGMLTIKCARIIDSRAEGTQYSRIERRHGSFHRRFALPDSANPKVTATTARNKVLGIVILKRPETISRRIQVGTLLNSCMLLAAARICGRLGTMPFCRYLHHA